MPTFSCQSALTFGLKKLGMSHLTHIIAPTTEFELRLLRKSRMRVNKNLHFNLGNMAS